MEFRPCGDCHECCTGKLVGNQYGNLMYPGRPCAFLLKDGCGIHGSRPKECRSYQCAWSQNLFPEWMRPDKTDALISVEVKDGKQYLKVIHKSDLNAATVDEINDFCERNECEVMYVRL